MEPQPQEVPFRTCKLSRQELLEFTKPNSDEKYGILDMCPGCLYFNHYCMVMTHPPFQGRSKKLIQSLLLAI